MKPVRNATLMDNPTGLLRVWKAEEEAYPGSSVKLQDVIAELETALKNVSWWKRGMSIDRVIIVRSPSRWGRFKAAFQALF